MKPGIPGGYADHGGHDANFGVVRSAGGGRRSRRRGRASPVASAGADDVISELESQGYTVHINWTNGFDTKPLSECSVTGVNNPSNQEPGPGTFVTVYVDVACPNHDY